MSSADSKSVVGHIHPLAPELRSLLRTGVALTSVTQCVEELVLNSLDAGAICIAVRVDLSCFKIQVVDNGCGMTADQLGKIGERYSTSKCHTVEDLDNLTYFGYRGEALASLRNSSLVLEITSRAKHRTQTFCKLFQQGKSLPVVESSVSRPSAGTTVTVHDLFYNFPVRKKSVSDSIEFERVRQRIEGIALMKPDVSFTLRNDVTSNVVIQTHKTNSILNAFTYLFGISRTKILSEVELKKGQFLVSGYIGKEGYSRKDLQFLYVNGRLVLKTRIHKLINNILGKSLILKRKNISNMLRSEGENSPSLASSPTKFTPKYGIFVINIVCPYTEYDITFEPAKTLVEFKSWDLLCSCVEELVSNFLKDKNLYVGTQPLSTSNLESDETNLEERDEEKKMTECEGNSSPSSSYAQGICTSNSKNFLTSKSVKRQFLSQAVVDKQQTLCDLPQTDCHAGTNNALEDQSVENPSVDRVSNPVPSISKTDVIITKTPDNSSSDKAPRPVIVRETSLSSSDDQDEPRNEKEEFGVEYEEEDPFVKLTDIVSQDSCSSIHSEVRSGIKEESLDGLPLKKSMSYIHIPTPYISHPGGSALSQFRRSLSKGGNLKSTNLDSSEVRKSSCFSLKQKIAEMRKERNIQRDVVVSEKRGTRNFDSTDYQELDRSALKNSNAQCERFFTSGDKNYEQIQESSCDNEQKKNELAENELLSLENLDSADADKSELMAENFTVLVEKKHMTNLNPTVAAKLSSMIRTRKSTHDKQTIGNAERESTLLTKQIQYPAQKNINESSTLYRTVPESSHTAEGSRSFLTSESLIQTADNVFRNIAQRTNLARRGSSVQEEGGSHYNGFKDALDLTYAPCYEKNTMLSVPECNNDHGAMTAEPGRQITPSLTTNANSFLRHSDLVVNESWVIQESPISGIECLTRDNNLELSKDTEDTDLFCYETVESPPTFEEAQLMVNEGWSTEYRNDRDVYSSSQEFLPHIATPTSSRLQADEEVFGLPVPHFSSSQGFLPDIPTPGSSQSRAVEEVFGLPVPQSQGFETNFSSWKDEQDPGSYDSQGFIPVPHFSTNRTVSPAGSEGFTPLCSEEVEPSNTKCASPLPVHHDMEQSETSHEFLTLTHFLESDSSSIAELYSEDERVHKLNFRKRKNEESQESKLPSSGCPQHAKKLCEENNLVDNDNLSHGLVHDNNNTNKSDVLLSEINEQNSVDGTQPINNVSDSGLPSVVCSLNEVNRDKTLAAWPALSDSVSNNNNITSQSSKGNKQVCDSISVINSSCTQDTFGECSSAAKLHTEADQVLGVRLKSESMSSSQWSDVDETLLLAAGTTCETDQCMIDNKSVIVDPNDREKPNEETEGSSDGWLKETWIETTDPKTGRKLFVNKFTGHTKIPDQSFRPPIGSDQELSASPDNVPTNQTAVMSPQSHNALVQLMEDHFDQDDDEDDLASVKWTDKRRCSTYNEAADTNRYVEELFKEWQNPVFEHAEQMLQTAELNKPSSRGKSKTSRFLNPCKFSKEMLQNLQVIGQVDNKFIACLARSQTENKAAEPNLLILFDQHAVHERVRLERLTNGKLELLCSNFFAQFFVYIA